MRSMDKKFHLLYKTTNVLNGKYYYGIHSTNDIDDGYLGSGIIFRRSLKKYGKENFKREILEFFDSREKLSAAEAEIITEAILKDKQCMNRQYGGEGWNSTGTVTVRDANRNTFKVSCDDPRYLSGELVHSLNGMIAVKDKEGRILHVSQNDPRYLSGELSGVTKGMATVKDKDGNSFKVSCDNPRYLSGELSGVTKGMVTVKDREGRILHISQNDPRYLSGELIGINVGAKHTEEAKKKISESAQGKQIGGLNSQFGTCWITNGNVNRKIQLNDLPSFLCNGWIKGRIK